MLAVLLAALCGIGATGVDMQAELEKEWLRDAAQASTAMLPPNPSGEPQGARTFVDAAGAVDGVRNGEYGFHTTFSVNPWWQVDLQHPFELDRIVVYNRGGAVAERAAGMAILTSLDGQAFAEVYRHAGPPFGGAFDGKPLAVDLSRRGVRARFVRCQMEKQVSFHLDEVEVYAADDPARNIALHKPADQSSAGRWSRPHGTGSPAVDGVGSGVVDEIMRTARLLLPDLSRQEREGFREELASLESRIAAARGAPVPTQLYFEAREVRRGMALHHPDLEFDDLLFVKRHPGVFPHMCDQYYGGYARAGGGLFALESFRVSPRLREIVGAAMMPGSLLSPDLSYDGRTVAFAYTRVDPSRPPRFEDDPEWTYHVLIVPTAGGTPHQLTDGPYDEFDPCWLPDGGIAFISTRRGGYCRCGARPVPTYTLYRMAADGTGIRQLSSHETNEWHPVVSNDGTLVYTRWDYVDRHTNIAHSLWSCLPDGSSAMALFGNYNTERKPWGLWHPQPIPGSHKLLAIAGAHHGQAFGSVVRIDPRRGYDGPEPIERMTPDVPFPEAEGFPTRAYTTPWALSERAFLVAYSPDWNTNTAAHGVTQGLYLMLELADGTMVRELLYRDPAISSMDPIPLRPRPVPAAFPSERREGASGRFLVLNVRDTALPFPDDGRRVVALRVVQVLPKTTYMSDQPPMSVAKQVSARHLLGTVPVEEDGSAYFEAPAGMPLYFQAVDDQGMALQSMRSIAYLEPGETRTCVGCHEHRNTAPATAMPTALSRPPSAILPGPDGTRPFSFVRLVQPVLDRTCVQCHQGPDAAAGVRLTGRYANDQDPYTESYRALARRDLVPWFDSVNGGEWIPLTTPGAFGARASRLIALLREGHHGVELTGDELERLCIWVDLNVPFYGSYEPSHVAVQRSGGVPPLSEIMQ